MELRQLECFVRTAEVGSFTKAADLLHISQPALSKNIALLESGLGVKLFDRRGKRFTLSATGAQVLDHAKAVLDHVQQIQLLCQSDRQIQSSVFLRMKCAAGLFSEIMSGFHQRYPEISVSLRQNNIEVAKEDADVLVFSSRQKHEYYANRTVMAEELKMLVPPGHPLYARESISLREIGEYPILSLTAGNDMRMMEDYYYTLADIAPRREIECENPNTLQSLLETGYGIAMVPSHTWGLLNSGQNRLIPIWDFTCIRYINVQLFHPNQADRNVQRLFEYLIEFFSKLNQ